MKKDCMPVHWTCIYMYKEECEKPIQMIMCHCYQSLKMLTSCMFKSALETWCGVCRSLQVHPELYSRPTFCIKVFYLLYSKLGHFSLTHVWLKLHQGWRILVCCQCSLSWLSHVVQHETTSNMTVGYMTWASQEWDSLLCLGNLRSGMCFHKSCWTTVSLVCLLLRCGGEIPHI